MTLPDPGHMIPFSEAQKAIKAVTDAYDKAIRDTITDGDLRTTVMATVAGNILYTMLSGLGGVTDGDRTKLEQAQLDSDTVSLFDRLFNEDK